MKVSPQALKEFRDLYHQKYGVQLDDETAQREAKRLLQVFQVIYGTYNSWGEEVKQHDR